jgi:hypothetical protein
MRVNQVNEKNYCIQEVMKTDSRVEQIFYKSGSKGDMLSGICAALYYRKVEDR